MREYKTQMEAARRGIITPEIKKVAAKQYRTEEEIREMDAKACCKRPGGYLRQQASHLY